MARGVFGLVYLLRLLIGMLRYVAWLSLSLDLLVSLIFNSSSLDFTVLNILPPSALYYLDTRHPHNY